MPPYTLELSSTDLTVPSGYSREELLDVFHGNFLEMIPQKHRVEFQQRLSKQLLLGDEVEFPVPLRCKDGEDIWVLNKCRRVRHSNGKEYLCGMLTPIPQLRSSYDALEYKLNQLNIVLAQTENIIFEWNIAEDSIFFSDTWERIFGYKPITERFGATVAIGSHLHPDDVASFLEHFQLLKNGVHYQTMEARIANAKGEYIWCRFRATAIFDADNKICKLVGIIINIDAEKRAASALRSRAEQDSLTKLFNNKTAQEKAAQYLSNISGDLECCLLIIDLDNFKHINDRYGHMLGDTVLTKCARKIKTLFRPDDIVARIGGDEFLVLMKDVSNRELVQDRCSQLIVALRTILREQPLSCSIGIAFAPEHGSTYYDLFIAADQALYYAKDLGKNQYAFYHEKLASHPASCRFPSAINQQIDSNDYVDVLAEDHFDT